MNRHETTVRRIRRGLVIATVVALLVFAAARVQTPFYVLRPGDVINLGEVVSLDGKTQPQGGIRMLTVAARVATGLDMFYALVNPNMTLIAERQLVPPGMDLESYMAYAEDQMRREQAIAEYAALKQAGRTVHIQGGGLRVTSISDSSPWAGRLMKDDVVVGADGQPIWFLEDLVDHLRDQPVGTLTVRRGDNQFKVNYEQADVDHGVRDERELLRGVHVSNEDWSVVTPVELAVDFTNVKGPSAGLSLALEMYRRVAGVVLEPDTVVAATGTLSVSGEVGAVGGVDFKLRAAKAAGVTAVIIPEADPVPERWREGLPNVLMATTLSQAVHQLQTLGQ